MDTTIPEKRVQKQLQGQQSKDFNIRSVKRGKESPGKLAKEVYQRPNYLLRLL